jgi:hypothetical protein
MCFRQTDRGARCPASNSALCRPPASPRAAYYRPEYVALSDEIQDRGAADRQTAAKTLKRRSYRRRNHALWPVHAVSPPVPDAPACRKRPEMTSQPVNGQLVAARTAEGSGLRPSAVLGLRPTPRYPTFRSGTDAFQRYKRCRVWVARHGMNAWWIMPLSVSGVLTPAVAQIRREISNAR